MKICDFLPQRRREKEKLYKERKMIWNKEAECMRIGEREKLQLERLKAILRRAYKNVPYYKKRFDELKVKPVRH